VSVNYTLATRRRHGSVCLHIYSNTGARKKRKKIQTEERKNDTQQLYMSTIAVLSPVHTVAVKWDSETVAEKCDCTVAEKWDSLTFLRQCGQGFILPRNVTINKGRRPFVLSLHAHTHTNKNRDENEERTNIDNNTNKLCKHEKTCATAYENKQKETTCLWITSAHVRSTLSGEENNGK